MTADNAFILIVDDDDVMRATLSYSLVQAGYHTEQASCADEAIQKLALQPWVVLLDMGMPPNKHTPDEGLKVLDAVQALQLPTKVVVLTGQDADKTAYLAIKHGAFDFLQKPVDETALLQAVRRAALFYQQSQRLESQENIQQLQVSVALGDGVKQVRNQAEEKIVRKVLQQTYFNVHETARRLGLKRENVYYLIKKYHIERPETVESH